MALTLFPLTFETITWRGFDQECHRQGTTLGIGQVKILVAADYEMRHNAQGELGVTSQGAA